MHALETLIETGKQIFARSPLAIGAGPHEIAGFCRDDELVAVLGKICRQNAAEVRLRRSRRRTVIIGQVEMRYAVIKRLKDHFTGVLEWLGVPEVLPEPERNARQLQSAAAAAGIGMRLVSINGGGIHRQTPEARKESAPADR